MSRKYTHEHEWLAPEDDGVWLVGITDYAQEQLGDVVAVELPEIGRVVSAGEECAVVESVKAASDIYAPVAGKVVAVNGALEEDPDLVNESPEEGGWLFKIEVRDADMSHLLDADAYKKLTAD